jgi:anti-sigma B factor antagonist
MRTGSIDWDEKRGIIVMEIAEPRVTSEYAVNVLGTSFAGIVRGRRGIRAVLDFRLVIYLTSAALGLVTKLSRDTSALGGKLVLCGMRPEIRQLFRLTKLDTVVEIHEDLESAKLALEVWTAGPH